MYFTLKEVIFWLEIVSELRRITLVMRRRFIRSVPVLIDHSSVR
nr:MAG TPA_asm: hypothetical protein [Microviridae sp.]